MSNDLELAVFCCEADLPNGVSVGKAWLTGQFVATCAHSGFVCAYWDCPCELSHDCEGAN